MKIYNYLKKTGFTLIELIIVIAILGILASMAYVAYPNMTAQANVTKVAQAAKKVQEGFELTVINGSYLPQYENVCLNPETDESCMDYTDKFNEGSIYPDNDRMERFNSSFNLATLSNSSYFNKSDLVYFAKLPFITSFKSDNQTVKYAQRRAVGYHIGSQKNCANDDVAWYDKNNKIYFTSKPTEEQIAANGLKLTRYYPIDDSHNLCVLLISSDNNDVQESTIANIPDMSGPIPM